MSTKPSSLMPDIAASRIIIKGQGQGESSCPKSDSQGPVAAMGNSSEAVSDEQGLQPGVVGHRESHDERLALDDNAVDKQQASETGPSNSLRSDSSAATLQGT
jgi:hypothetical protein